jgi:hypothetical protein
LTCVVSCDGTLEHNDHYLAPEERDGNQKIIYENYRRQVMLEVDRILVDPANPSNVGKMWGNYTRFDASTGNSIW